MMRTKARGTGHLLMGMLCAMAIGCGGSHATPSASVEGTVTIDGQPASEVQVMFVPAAGGRPVMAVTNAEGHYELTFSSELDGTAIGEHNVSFQPAAEDDAELQQKLPGFPVQYMQSGAEIAIVDEGSNTIDFDLKSAE
ncbi:MAG: carboxypeptidase-like regulatory domain-containing protein [Rubinisphaera brasiliensis]|uniref:carboxypeptidase-like regulatory domain-containing protein n=1 Tax=Rubinisphaera brasiliensis TaxID=119 RepID=UPI00391B0119|nr:carboxypeptidase regulatory-like domain-containing protein [bacterium]